MGKIFPKDTSPNEKGQVPSDQIFDHELKVKKENEITTPMKEDPPQVKTQDLGETMVRKQETMKCALAN